jgi:hypothetical protein
MNSRKSLRLFGVLVAAIVGLLVVALPGTAAARDRNHDRIPDRWEKRHHLSLHKNQAKRDQDRDGLKNRQEWKAGDDPRDPDSNNDGTEDGDEGAGTVSSFQDHVLTINLFHGGSVSGLVTDATEIKCDNGDDQGDEDGDAQDQDDQGDDQGDQNDDDQGDLNDDGVHAKGTPGTSDDESGDENDDDQGDLNDDQGDQNDDNHACSVDNLAQGAVVQEAELDVINGDAVFEEIELAQ